MCRLTGTNSVLLQLLQGGEKRANWLRNSTAQVGKYKDARQYVVRVAGQVWGQRAAHSERAPRNKPIPQNLNVKSGGHVRSCSLRQNEENTPKYVSYQVSYVSIGHTALRNETSRRHTVVRVILRRREIKTDERKTKRQHTQDARKESEERTML